MYYLIVFGSITFAARIKKYFTYDGDYVAIVHTPREISKGGCSYSVKVKPKKLKQILDISKQLGFKVKGVFEQTCDGKYIEVENI